MRREDRSKRLVVESQLVEDMLDLHPWVRVEQLRLFAQSAISTFFAKLLNVQTQRDRLVDHPVSPGR
jgi:hypothetical protein